VAAEFQRSIYKVAFRFRARICACALGTTGARQQCEADVLGRELEMLQVSRYQTHS
jgi:hypothetical protein